MKKLYFALFFVALTLNPASRAQQQLQSPTPQNSVVWSVSGVGCPAAGALPAVLAPQWTAALTAVSGNAAETAQVQAQQTYITARIAAYLAANPQQNIFVMVTRPASTSRGALSVVIYPVALPAGNSCPAS
jgi:hypothetical protein